MSPTIFPAGSIGYMRIRADRRDWWRRAALDAGRVAVFLAGAWALLTFALGPLPPGVP